MPATTFDSDKWGYAFAISSTHAGARGASTANAAASDPTSNQNDAISYVVSSGRGRGLTYRISRTFAYFDLSVVSGTISECKLYVRGNGNGTAKVTVCSATAFGGDGNSNLSTSD